MSEPPSPLKIVFLDCDGVVSPMRGTFFQKEHMLRLKRIVEETGAKVVLSSSWRLTEFGRNEVNRQLREYGIQECIGYTEDLTGKPRSAEIVKWVEDNRSSLNIVNFVALDDIPLTNLAQDRVFFGKHCVTTNGSVGLSDTDTKKAISLLSDDNNF